MENGFKEGKVTRRLLQQFRWEILMTWTKVLMLKMERREQGRRSNWLDVVVDGTMVVRERILLRITSRFQA